MEEKTDLKEEIKQKAEEKKQNLPETKPVKAQPATIEDRVKTLEMRLAYLEQQMSVSFPTSEEIEEDYNGKLYKITKNIPSESNPGVNSVANSVRTIEGRKVVFDSKAIGTVTEKQLTKALAAGYSLVKE